MSNIVVPAEKDNVVVLPEDVQLSATVEGYDATLEYTEDEETRVGRLIDTRFMPWILFSTFVLNMDRTNISNAISGGLPRNLGFTITVINNAGSMYAVLFSIAAFFGSILAKRFGPHKVIPAMVFSWGLVTLGHGFIKDTSQYYLIRALIALTEGGVIPATLVYLGSFYKKNELATRLSWFWGVQTCASAVSGLMASGLLQLEGVNGLNGWRWLFIVDGIITILAAVGLSQALPRSPFHTKDGFLNFGGWLDSRQSHIAVTRVVRDDILKLQYESRVTLNDVWETLVDYKVWGHLIITLLGLTYLTPYGTYLPSIINSFGFNVYVANALTAPNAILGFITMTTLTWHSDRRGERGWHGVFANTWLLIGFLLLEFVPDDAPKGVSYFITFIISGAPFVHPLNIAWMSENTGPIGKRTVASGLIIAAANIYGTYAAQIYQASDAPRFHTGNYIIIGFVATTILLWINQKFLYIRLNKQRAAVWNSKSQDEKADYDATTKDKGSNRLDFVFKP
ncbi:MFS general substrate transporter [Rhizoclosmatium globosum]|uniref:MFS general substrate transporter n=1 Tax=Rhizoclosmatium globosum TaxID=329046 RepID=A0A1Y2CKP8_9FUNG|nr:MFS general substrate transporter [Rhizoclosmatium globosum]|eukprot:ORY47599.1 MFS general substrate transporter [Rhizoclosmatium globosum]